MAQQYEPGVLLDATGNPFTSSAPLGLLQPPPGSYGQTGGYAATTIIVQPDGGRVELTEQDARGRFMPYADLYASQAPVAAVVGKMNRRLAALSMKVYQWPAGNRTVSMPATGNKPPRTRKAHAEEIWDPDNGIVSLLEHPAPRHGAMSLREWRFLSTIVNGGSLLAKYRGNGRLEPPTEMFPLDWRFLQAWARVGQPVIAWATVQTGQLKWIAPSETLFTSWTTVAGANGAWLCTSPLQQLGITIRIDEAAQRYASAYFKNAAKPAMSFTFPPEVPVAQVPQLASAMQEQLQESYGGVDNAFRTFVTGGGAKAEMIGGSAQEAQMVETREQDLREICAVLDQPFDAMFGIQAATPEGEAQCWKALMPLAAMGDDRFNAQVIYSEPEWLDGRFFVKTDFNEALYGDLLVLSDKVIAEVGAGLVSTNEGRITLGRPPLDDPAYDELIYHGANAGLVGELPGSLSIGEEEREMVMPPPGEDQPLDPINDTLGPTAGGA